MQETGKIIKVKRSQAVVRVDRKSACGSCGACAMKPSQMHILNHFMVKYLEKMLYMTNVIFTFVAWIAINVR